MIGDGFATGVTAVVWVVGVILGALVILGPMAFGLWLLERSWRTLRYSRPGWWLRAQRAVRRLRRARS